jgi:ABC-type polysaccharide/polyol phosphate transport system ATPase subunit
MKPILEVQHLGKKYRIRHQAGGYLSLRERLLGAFRFSKNTIEDFWALNDISFEVQPGESIGIIGRNGAGKSTLLKILSKITPPTNGRIITRGRIASLLEVGTGFHPELTGRENIFFNGSLLGMKRKEIDAKFDAIVDFSGTEQFLDTPLKHYSSGMQLRLAFSVAAFLEPEILIIDEVLAVGDAEFQKKCLAKMEDVSHSGRTILFVSHDLDSVEKLCKNAMLLSKGALVAKGPSSELISTYLSDTTDRVFQKVSLTPSITLEEFSFKDSIIHSGNDLEFEIRISKTSAQGFLMNDLCLLFYNYKKQRVAIFDLRNFFSAFVTVGNELKYSGVVRHFNLIEGIYYVGLFYGFNATHGDVYDLVKIQVKNEPDKLKVKPYDVQYRGYVEFN